MINYLWWTFFLVCDGMKSKPHIVVLWKLQFLDPDYSNFQVLLSVSQGTETVKQLIHFPGGYLCFKEVMWVKYLISDNSFTSQT